MTLPSSPRTSSERLDKNRDGIIHADDLEDVIRATLGPEKLNRREVNILLQAVELPRSNHSVEFKKLHDVLELNTLRNTMYSDSGLYDTARDEYGRPLETWTPADEANKAFFYGQVRSPPP